MKTSLKQYRREFAPRRSWGNQYSSNKDSEQKGLTCVRKGKCMQWNKPVHLCVHVCVPPLTHDSWIIDCCSHCHPRDACSHLRCTEQHTCQKYSMPRGTATQAHNVDAVKASRVLQGSLFCWAAAIDLNLEVNKQASPEVLRPVNPCRKTAHLSLQ